MPKSKIVRSQGRTIPHHPWCKPPPQPWPWTNPQLLNISLTSQLVIANSVGISNLHVGICYNQQAGYSPVGITTLNGSQFLTDEFAPNVPLFDPVRQTNQRSWCQGEGSEAPCDVTEKVKTWGLDSSLQRLTRWHMQHTGYKPTNKQTDKCYHGSKKMGIQRADTNSWTMSLKWQIVTVYDL